MTWVLRCPNGHGEIPEERVIKAKPMGFDTKAGKIVQAEIRPGAVTCSACGYELERDEIADRR